MQKVGINIKKIRELRNYSRLYMARELKLSANSYGKIERNEVNISIKRLHEIASILEVASHLILEFDENEFLNAFSRNKKK